MKEYPHPQATPNNHLQSYKLGGGFNETLKWDKIFDTANIHYFLS